MLAGDLMLRAGIIDDIITLCNVLVGRLRGGLAHVNIVASMFFAGITGSAVSDTAALGSILIPSMRRNGYDADFAVAVTSASSVIGPIIPPSIGMVIYGTVVSVSIGGLFAGGMIPGILLGLGLMIVAYTISKKRGFGYSRVTYTGRELIRILLRSIPALMTPVIILGGIFGGVFTPTEAAGVAVTYSPARRHCLLQNPQSQEHPPGLPGEHDPRGIGAADRRGVRSTGLARGHG